ncbi:zf-HC2 domain-containing protein [Microbacterium betulae]|uniref:Zf-HC2 domain-containing protein n=1 Tax=Microbacterium betulae TaxID=2981139 RepID=A0AA97FFX5_9MICO|nr:zf-HC2 domain-containing protein [Microbacterium sp. AB]WOF22183.1 zf-HC2 domain-containing protein [Microbacterium sp. AB]
MSDCGCDKARRDLEAYLRGAIELCKTQHTDIKEHIDRCPSCQDEVLVERTLTEAIQRSCREEVAPEQLRDHVLAQLRAAHTVS